MSGIGYIGNTNDLGIWGSRGNAAELPQIMLRDNGYVGINNTNPVANLHLVGAQVISSNDATGGSLSVYKGQLGATAEQRLLVSGDNVDVYGLRVRQISAGIFNSAIKASIDNAGNGYFAGSVGIGASVTGSYKLIVEGTIGARKVKVTQGAWADYVFDPAYALKPLETVEQFIKQHKHLPEVPSEKEVLKEGVDLGDTQVVLLSKIEELTLYIIELNKSLKQQQQIIMKQQDKVEELEKRVGIKHKR